MMPERWTLPDYWVPCPEIDALAEELALLGVRFVVEGPRAVPGWHIVYDSTMGDVSVVWHPWSYGNDKGLLEAMPQDVSHPDAVGWLTAGDVLRLFPPEVVA